MAKPRFMRWTDFPCVTVAGVKHCRWCKQPIHGRRGTFCSHACRDEVLIRTSNSDLRRLVYRRDRGVCALCGLNCSALHAEVRHLATAADRSAYLQQRYGFPRCAKRKTYWDVDHVLAVKDGGGSVGLSSLRTLCLRCHSTRTRRQQRGLDKIGMPKAVRFRGQRNS